MTATIGDQLKQSRLARKLTLEQAVQATRIRAHYLQALEGDNFEALPSPVQARGFLRMYADYLGIDSVPLIAALNGETPPAPEVLESDAPGPIPVPIADVPPPAPREPEPVAVEEAQLVEDVEEFPRPRGVPSLSQSIFNEIGQSLQQRRELLSLTLDEIERHTLVRQHYLQMIEVGAFDDLPSPVQARGMLNSYARFLDMDAEALLLRFADALQARRVENLPRDFRRKTVRSEVSSRFTQALRRAFSVDLVVGGGMIALMVFFGVWGANQIIAAQETPAAPQATAPSISDVLLTPNTTEEVAAATATLAAAGVDESLATATSTGEPLEIIDTLEPSATVRSNIQLVVTVLQRTWIRVTVDDKVVFEGRAEGGRGYPFTGNRRIEVLTGNGAAVQVTYNQLDLGAMGAPDEVVNRIYTVQGIFTPTATITPLPSATPRPSATLRPSPTPRRTATPEP